MKTFQLKTNPKNSARLFELGDDRTTTPPQSLQGFAKPEGRDLEAKQQEIAAFILAQFGQFGGRAFLPEFMASKLFKDRFWDRGEKITEAEIIQEMRTSLRPSGEQ